MHTVTGNGNNTSFCPVAVKTFAMPVPTSISRKTRSHIMPSLACGMGWDRTWKFTLLGRAQRPWLCEDWRYHKGASFFGYPQLSISCGLCYFKNKNIYIILCNIHVDFYVNCYWTAGTMAMLVFFVDFPHHSFYHHAEPIYQMEKWIHLSNAHDAYSLDKMVGIF